MATVTSAPSTVVSAGNWAKVGNTYTSNNVYATYNPAAANTDYPFQVGGFDFTTVPTGATIGSVTVAVEAKVSTASSYTFTGQLFDGATLIGTPSSMTLTTADTTPTFTVAGVTAAQLKSSTFGVQIVGRKSTGTRTFSVDYITVTANTISKVGEFTDDCTGTITDKWTLVNGGGSYVSGECRMPFAGGTYPWITVADKSQDLIGSAALLHWTSVPPLSTDGSGSREIYLRFLFDDSNLVDMYRPGLDAVMAIRYALAGVDSTTYVSVPSTDSWWRISEAGGSILWDTSTDGVTWTNRRTVANPFTSGEMSTGRVMVRSNDWGSQPAAYASWDDFNLPPVSSGTDYTAAPADTAAGSDTVGVVSARAATVGDTAAGSDTVAAGRACPVSDAAAGSDTITAARDVPAAVADAAPGTDTVTVGVGKTAAADSAAGVDAVTVACSVDRSVADAAPGGDSVAGAFGQSPVVGDSAAATDAVSTSGSVTRAVGDAAAGGDAVAAVSGYARDVADAATGTDSASPAANAGTQVGDAAAASDTTTTTATAGRALADTASAIDTVATVHAGTSTVSDAAAAVDDVTLARVATVAVADTAAATDVETHDVASAGAASVSDAATAADTAATTRAAARSAADAADGSDSTTVARARPVTDTAPAVDAVTIDKTATGGAAVSDTANGSDATTTVQSSTAPLSDAASGADTATPTRDWDRALQELVAATDTVTAVKAVTKTGAPTDTATVTDTIATTKTTAATVTDTAPATDLVGPVSDWVLWAADVATSADTVAAYILGPNTGVPVRHPKLTLTETTSTLTLAPTRSVLELT